MPVTLETRTTIDTLTARAADIHRRLACPGDDVTVRALYATFDGFPDRVIYNRVPAALTGAVVAISQREAADVPRVLRLLVLHALTESLARLAYGTALPLELLSTALRTLTLLLRSLETEADTRYVLSDDTYVKDLQVARLRLVPMGSQLVDPFQGFSRKSFLLGRGVLGLPRALASLQSIGGHVPWHEFHTYDLTMRFFSARGWEETLRLCAPLLRRDPEVRGIVASAWWFDPAVGRLTPNMAFPHDVSARFGARFFPMPRDEQSRVLAVYRSPVRSAQVEAGRYDPQPYLMVLPRAALLAST